MNEYLEKMREVKRMRISINLTTCEYERLKSKAEDCGTSINKILAQFIADLTWSERSGGSDERDLADEWLSRSRYNF